MIKPRFIFNEIKKYLDSPEAIVITGMRRTGKTTVLNYFYNQIDSKNKIFLDLENPLNRKYFEERNYEKIKKPLNSWGLSLQRNHTSFWMKFNLLKIYRQLQNIL